MNTTNNDTSYTREFYEVNVNLSVTSARVIAPLIMQVGGIRSVVDVGCGVGGWAREFKRCGAQKILGVDGEWVDVEQLLISREEFMSFDLTKPIKVDQEYDLAVCMEVAEHIPEEHASTLIDSLVSLAPIVLFSAAIPGQIGTNHVNCQWPSYWSHLFASHGFACLDFVRGQVWDNEEVGYWYAQNALVFAHQDLIQSNPVLGDILDSNSYHPLDLVHPRHYLANLLERKHLREIVSLLPSAIARAARNRVSRVRGRVISRLRK